MEALTELTCLTLARDRFTELLGPLQDIMKRDKSPEVQSSAACLQTNAYSVVHVSVPTPATLAAATQQGLCWPPSLQHEAGTDTRVWRPWLLCRWSRLSW